MHIYNLVGTAKRAQSVTKIANSQINETGKIFPLSSENFN